MSDQFSELQRNAFCLMQALVGVVTNNFRLVTIGIVNKCISIQIVLEIYCEADIDEIEDLKTEFEALMPGPTDFTVNVVVSPEVINLDQPTESTIIVYKRRE